MGLSTEPHPNDMRSWGEIACRRSHEHTRRRVTVDLAQRHGYLDLAPVPARLARRFEMMVWDPVMHPVDGGPYCPAADAVSETIVNQRIWEPTETILTLAACCAAHDDSLVVDFGAQLGWFSLLAASCGLDVDAIEADPENARLLAASCELNGWSDSVSVTVQRITEASGPILMRPIALAKIDVEGSERDAVAMLRPSIEAGLVDHLLIEVTPLFADYYGGLVADLVEQGYRAWRLPPKNVPPFRMMFLPEDLEPWRISDLPRAELVALVDSWRQEMVWFSRPGAKW